MNEPFAIFLTVFGLGGIPIAIGFIVATRGAVTRPWVAPWRAAYGFFALGFLLTPFASQEASQRLALPIGHALFLLGAGLHALGWLRLWRGATPLALAALPLGLYGMLFFAWGSAGGVSRWAALFSILFALTTAVSAFSVQRGVDARHSRHRTSAIVLLVLQSLFWAVRAVHNLAGFPGMDFLVSFSAAMVEGTLYLGLLAYLQWSLIMD